MGKPDEPLHDLEWLSGYLGGIPERTICRGCRANR